MRVFLVDNQPIFREGLKSILCAGTNITVVGEASTCRDMLPNAKDADLLILDGEVDSLALLNSLQKSRSTGRPPYVLILTKRNEEQHAVQMLKAGADGYVDKSAPPGTVMEAIRRIEKGRKYVPHDLAEVMIFSKNKGNGPGPLSQREYQVLCLLASGLGASEIAAHLSLSVKTISTYRSRLLEKLNLTSTAQLMRYAFKNGMMS